MRGGGDLGGVGRREGGAAPAVGGSPPPPKPNDPAGVTWIDVPTLLETDWTRWAAAWCETSITRASAKVTERMRTTATVRVVFRNAFLAPRRTVPTWPPLRVVENRTAGT